MRPLERDKRARALQLLSQQDHHNRNILSKSTAHIKTHERAYRVKLNIKREAEEALRLANEAYDAQKAEYRDAFNADLALKKTVARNQERINERMSGIENVPDGREAKGLLDPLDLEDVEAPEPATGYQAQEPAAQQSQDEEEYEVEDVRRPSNDPTRQPNKGKDRARSDPPDAVTQQPDRDEVPGEPDAAYEASSESDEEPLAVTLARRKAQRQQGILPTTRLTQQANPSEADVESEAASEVAQRPAKKPKRARKKQEKLGLSMEFKTSMSGKEHHLFRIHTKQEKGMYAKKDAVSSRIRTPRQRTRNQEEDGDEPQQSRDDEDDGGVVLSDGEEDRICQSDEEWLARQRSQSMESHISVRPRRTGGALQTPGDGMDISPDILPNDEPYEELGQDAPEMFPFLMGATNWSNRQQRQEPGPELTADRVAMHNAISEGDEVIMLPYDPNHGSDWETVSSTGTGLFVSERLLMRPKIAREVWQPLPAEDGNDTSFDADQFLEHFENSRSEVSNDQLPRDYSTPDNRGYTRGDSLLNDSVGQRFRSMSMGAYDQGDESAAQLPTPNASSVDEYGRERSFSRSDTGQTGVGLFVTGRTPDPDLEPERYERLMKRRSSAGGYGDWENSPKKRSPGPGYEGW